MERGTHNELLARGGYYNDLYQAQFAGQEETQSKIDAALAEHGPHSARVETRREMRV